MPSQTPYAQGATTADGGSGTVDWVAAANAEDASDTTYASCPMDLAYSEVSYDLQLEGFAFDIPAGSTITKITVTVRKYAYTPTELNEGVLDDLVALMWNGSQIGENRAKSSPWPDTVAEITYGDEEGENTLWGLPDELYSNDDILTMLNNGFNIGVILRAVSGVGGSDPTEYYNTAYVDSVAMTVEYSTPSRRGCIV